MIEQAIIMAGGEGQRLRPLTEERPKPLMPLLDEPVIGMTLRLLHRHGIDRVTITLRYMAQSVMDALGDGSAYGVRIRYSVETAPRGTAGSVRDAARGIDDPVLILSGDGLTDCDLRSVCDRHEAGDAPFSMVVRHMQGDLSPYGLCLVRDGKLTGFAEKPTSAVDADGIVNTGIYVADPVVFDSVADEGPVDFAKDLIPDLLADGVSIGAIDTDAYWCDIGTRDAYHQAQMDLLMGRVGLPVLGERRGHAIVAPGSRIENGVRVTGRCYIGRGASVGRGTTLGPGTILNTGARVGRNVRLENTTLWEHAAIDCGTVLRNVVVVPRKGDAQLQQLVLCGSAQARNAT